MTDFRHGLLLFSGGYTDEALEHWQFGIRLLIVNSVTTPDDEGDLPTNDVNHVSAVRHEADWDIENLWTTNVGIDAFAPDDYLNDQAAPAIITAITALQLSNHVRLDALKLSPITTLGHVADLRTCRLTWTGSNPTGANSGNALPIQDAVAVSWQTPVLGRKGRGRIFLPQGTSSNLDSGGGLDGGRADGIAAAAATMLEDISLTPGLGGGWHVRPIVTAARGTHYGVVTQVRVGNVIDTQRRRRRSLKETYHDATPSY
jgi:hypothetical protein